MDLLQKIKAGTNNRKRIKWPGTDIEIDLKLLSDDDLLMASLATDKVFEGHKIGVENMRFWESEHETQILYRTIKDPETGNAIFKNITDFRQALTPEIKDMLNEELDNFQADASPNPIDMSDEEFDKLYNDLKKKPEETIGNVLSLSIAKRLLSCLVNPPKI